MMLMAVTARLRSTGGMLRREVVERMRAPASAWLLALYVTILGAVSFLYLFLAADTSIGTAFTPQMGLTVFAFLTTLQVYLLALLAPAAFAGTVARERAGGGLRLMLLHGRTPLAVLLGKLGGAVAFSTLMLLASGPLYMMLLLFGGVGWREVGVAAALLLSSAVLISALCLVSSVLLHSEAAAAVTSYLLILLLLGAPLAHHMIPEAPAFTRTGRLQRRAEPWAQALSPGRVLSATLRLEGGGLTALVLLAQAAGGVTVTNAQGGTRAVPLQILLLDGSTLQLTPGSPGAMPPEPRLLGRPLWTVHVALMQVGTLLCLAVGWAALSSPLLPRWRGRRGDRRGAA